MSNIPEGYDLELWDITFFLRGEDGEALTNPDGSVRLFKENDIDWSFVNELLPAVNKDVFYEVDVYNGDPL
jgi:hypothetical protein